MAAAFATLSSLADGQVHARMEQRGSRLMDGIAAALADADIPARVQGFPQIFHVALGVTSPITDYRSSLAADKPRYVRFTTGLLDHGVRALERGAWFLSDAHSDALVEETLAAVAKVGRGLRDEN